MRNPIETVLKSAFFIYMGVCFWHIKNNPNTVAEPSTLVTITLGAFASGFFVYGIIVFIANIRIGKTRKGIEGEIKKNLDNAFNNQKESDNSFNIPKKPDERKP